MALNKFLCDNRDVCDTVKKTAEAKNAVTSLKSNITLKTNSLEKMAAVVDKEKKRPSPNIEKINGEIMEYLRTKQLLYEKVTELRSKCEEFNSCVLVMKESPFIGENANVIIEQHMMDADKEHTKYLGKLTEMITKIEEKINMEREEKPVSVREGAGSRASSRNSSPSSSNYRKLNYVSQMDPGKLEESATLKDATDWWERMAKFMKIGYPGGYDHVAFIDQIDLRTDGHWRSQLGRFE